MVAKVNGFYLKAIALVSGCLLLKTLSLAKVGITCADKKTYWVGSTKLFGLLRPGAVVSCVITRWLFGRRGS